ncbi:MAG: MurR/RpiR family transcriptional regulator [Myxococcales bacterium]|nr:MurR/RpiR family transcriptional regulator [Myxococcales bacterium]
MARRPTPRLREPADLLALVRERRPTLPPQQQVVADLLVERLDDSPFFSVPTLAERAGVSEATVVRVAQRLGFSGFPELKAALLELVRVRLAGSDAQPPRTGTDALSAVTRLEAANLDRMLRSLDRRAFESAATALSDADHVFTFGAGLSAHLAELAAYQLVQAGVRTSPLSVRFTSPSEQLVVLRADDALLAFSLPPYSRPTLELLEDATARGLATVVVTDRATAPAASLARHALAVPTHNVLFTNALAALMVLINAFGVEIARQRGGNGLRALSEINRIVANDRDGLAGGHRRRKPPVAG